MSTFSYDGRQCFHKFADDHVPIPNIENTATTNISNAKKTIVILFLTPLFFKLHPVVSCAEHRRTDTHHIAAAFDTKFVIATHTHRKIVYPVRLRF